MRRRARVDSRARPRGSHGRSTIDRAPQLVLPPAADGAAATNTTSCRGESTTSRRPQPTTTSSVPESPLRRNGFPATRTTRSPRLPRARPGARVRRRAARVERAKGLVQGATTLPWGETLPHVVRDLCASLLLDERARGREFLALRGVDLGIAEVEASDRVDDGRCNDQTSKPLVVGGDDEPRRLRRCTCAYRLLVGALIFRPVVAFRDIRRRELPVLLGFVETRQKTPLLFLSRYVEKELHDLHAVAREIALEVCDVLVAFVPDALRDQRRVHLLSREHVRVHFHYQHFFVVRAVEDADLVACRHVGDVASTIVVIEFF